MIDFERVRFCLEISRGLKTAGGKYDEVRLLWLNQAAMELRFNPYHDPTNGRFTTGDKIDVDFSGGSGIIGNNRNGLAENDVHILGTIDIDKYKYITNKKILTNEVVITNNRIDHIIQRRGQSFYDEYHKYFDQIIKDPDYIFKDTKEDTAIVSKKFIHKGKVLNIVLRLTVEGDNPAFKNSIITAVGESEKRFTQRLRNNEPIYKKVDKDE